MYVCKKKREKKIYLKLKHVWQIGGHTARNLPRPDSSWYFEISNIYDDFSFFLALMQNYLSREGGLRSNFVCRGRGEGVPRPSFCNFPMWISLVWIIRGGGGRSLSPPPFDPCMSVHPMYIVWLYMGRGRAYLVLHLILHGWSLGTFYFYSGN